MDLQHLRASDGTGEAVLAHIQSVRNPGSTVLDLDNVDNWNSKAVVVTGTPAANGFISPVGMKVMYGHLNAGDFIIDGYAPGYADNGNTTAEVAIVKMTTNWADTLVDLLKQTLADNGKIKVDGIDNENMFADGVDPVKRAGELLFDNIASGVVWTGDNYGVNRNASGTAGIVYINGRRLTVAAVVARTFTASKDTYIDLLDAGNGTATIVYTEVANDAASPALAANSVRAAIIVTGAGNIASSGSINQGQSYRTLPNIGANEFMQVTDSLGNLICPRDSRRATIGYREIRADRATASGTPVDLTGLKATVKTVAGRKLKISFHSRWVQFTAAGNGFSIYLEEDGVQIAEKTLTCQGVSHAQNMDFTIEHTPDTAGTHVYNLKYNGAGGTMTVKASGTTGSRASLTINQD